jgi:DNA-binding CsgD family transcriptional regulator
MPESPLIDERDTDNRPYDRVVMVVLALVGIGGIVDLLLDEPTSWWSAHVLLELALVATSITLASTLWLRWRDVSTELRGARRSLEARESERQEWQATAEEALQSMRAAVEAQMDRWSLTPTEREIAFLLLQGVGHRQIAERTGRSERTVRQHAVSIYDKSGLDGRAALAGFFLQGLSGGKG